SRLSRYDYSFPYRHSSGTYVFFMRIPRPSRPTLLPYTTLFRSGSDAGFYMLCDLRAALQFQRMNPPLLHQSSGVSDRPIDAAMIDRKSTRLNSSHVKISYAVFCLKKKNT